MLRRLHRRVRGELTYGCRSKLTTASSGVVVADGVMEDGTVTDPTDLHPPL